MIISEETIKKCSQCKATLLKTNSKVIFSQNMGIISKIVINNLVVG